MKNVFILGAGVSAEAGVPVLGNFLSYVYKDLRQFYSGGLINDTQGEEARKNIHKIDMLESYAKATLGRCNVEELLSFLDFMVAIKGETGNRERRLLGNLQEIIKETIVTALDRIPRDRRSDEVYGKFFQMLMKGQNCPVITLNWDLLLDQYFGGLYDYGSKRFEPEDRLTDLEYPLLKLHGSMNWMKRNDTETVEIMTGKIQNQSEGPLLVMPTQIKDFKESIFGDIWQRALSELGQADRIFIIGFSFPETDQHFRQFLKHAIMLNKKNKPETELQIIVITRPKKLVQEKLVFENRYTTMLENDTGVKPNFYYMTFNTFVMQIGLIPALFEDANKSKLIRYLEEFST